MMKKLLLLIIIQMIAHSSFAQLIRGPYLQAATSGSIVIRWRTDIPADSRVQYGSSSNALDKSVNDPAMVTEHEIKITGLSPAARYFYSIGSSSVVYQVGEDNFFQTLPVSGTIAKYRFGVFGDCGTNSVIQDKVRDEVTSYLGNNYMNAMLLLGDNAYSFGTDAEYQSNFFNHYKDGFLKKYTVYPTPGNHDYSNDNFDRQNDHKIPYYDNFTMPANGEAGGVPSGTESYYSFDYGNVHFLSLDSYGREDRSTRLYDTTGRQVEWIKADLAANVNKGWIVAYWHHPPFSQGSRNSELDPEMTKIRENFIRILERLGVDLILCGHSHVYERTKLLNGFYEFAGQFSAARHNVSQSSGRYDNSENSCPYVKNVGSKGTVYVVSGSAGHLGFPSPGYPHPAMYYSDYEHGGALMLEVEGNRLDARWIGEDGQIRDQFTMEKDVNKVSSVEINGGNSVSLEASFKGTYRWNTGAGTKTISVAPDKDTRFDVRDAENCLHDVFDVKVNNPLPVTLTSFSAMKDPANLVTLMWTTLSENDFSHFSVERSFDAKEFTEIGKVSGQGGSASPGSYAFQDPQSPNLPTDESIYYRLKLVDQRGNYQYSRIVAIRLTPLILATDPAAPLLNVEVSPNPSSREDIRMGLAGKGTVTGNMQITDVSGRIIFRKKITVTDTPTPFVPAEIKPGIYFLKIETGNTAVVRKFAIR
jgi:hypothetical protein